MMHGSVELKSYSLYTLPKTNTNSPWIFHLSNIISDGICQRNLAPQESNRPRFATKKMQLYRLLLRPSALPVYLATWQQAAKENEEMVEWDISTMEKTADPQKKMLAQKGIWKLTRQLYVLPPKCQSTCRCMVALLPSSIQWRFHAAHQHSGRVRVQCWSKYHLFERYMQWFGYTETLERVRCPKTFLLGKHRNFCLSNGKLDRLDSQSEWSSCFNELGKKTQKKAVKMWKNATHAKLNSSPLKKN